MTHPDLLSTADTALMLGVSVTRIMQLMKSGRLQAWKIGGNYLFARADVRAFRKRPTGRPRNKKGA